MLQHLSLHLAQVQQVVQQISTQEVPMDVELGVGTFTQPSTFSQEAPEANSLATREDPRPMAVELRDGPSTQPSTFSQEVPGTSSLATQEDPRPMAVVPGTGPSTQPSAFFQEALGGSSLACAMNRAMENNEEALQMASSEVVMEEWVHVDSM
jgi:hypothetical protein